MHILHVIAPARRLVVTPDMGLEGVIEDDEETRRKVVRQHQQQGSSQSSSSQWRANVRQQQLGGLACRDSGFLCRYTPVLDSIVTCMATTRTCKRSTVW